MSSFQIKGIDELERQLKQMRKGAKELSETNEISFAELFTSSFMREYTPFSSIDELLDAGGFNAESKEDFESIPQSDLDKHIAATTKFNSWDNMLDEAVSQYISKKLGF